MPYKDPEKRREANRRHNKEYQKRNPGLQVSRNRERKKWLRKWLAEYRETQTCAQCGENHPACLDFHHSDPEEKRYNIYKIPDMGLGLERVTEELAKCIVLCANCHRKLHWDQGNYGQKNGRKIRR